MQGSGGFQREPVLRREPGLRGKLLLPREAGSVPSRFGLLLPGDSRLYGSARTQGASRPGRAKRPARPYGFTRSPGIARPCRPYGSGVKRSGSF